MRMNYWSELKNVLFYLYYMETFLSKQTQERGIYEKWREIFHTNRFTLVIILGVELNLLVMGSKK